MIEKMLGETLKLISVKYNEKNHQFDIECVLPGRKNVEICPLDKTNFPNHTPVDLLDEKVQAGDRVHVWLKEEQLLKREGWKETAKNLLSSPDSPFKIGKGKKVFLGGAHQGIIRFDKNFKPFVMIKEYRFSPAELKCVLKVDHFVLGRAARLKTPDVEWVYSPEQQTLSGSNGVTLRGTVLMNLIHLLRRAKLV